MRNRVIFLTAALLLASLPGMAQTQQPTPTPTPTAADFPWKGLIDFGGAFGSGYDGDEARYERYRDTRNGIYSDILASRETSTYAAAFSASHVGYRDQRYEASMEVGKGSFNFIFDGIPTNYLYGAFSPWNRGSTTLTLNDVYQGNVQNKIAQGVPCAPGNGPTCSFSTAAAALANRSIYNIELSTFDMRTTRNTLGLDGTFAAFGDLALNARFQNTTKSGDQPWGASFAFTNANELPLPIDQRTTDFGLGMEYAKPKGSVSVRWDGSWFNNKNEVLTWDNPVRLTDYAASTPVTFFCTPAGVGGPWDCNGYNNGNGPGQGRMSIFPSNSMNVVSGNAVYKLAKATAINGAFSFMTQSQNEELIPWTINQVIAQPATYVNFPELAELPRETAEASANGMNLLLAFTSRPINYLGLQARYRYNRRDVKTPHFDAVEYVRFDAVPEEIGGETEQFDVFRNTFDASATFSLVGYGSFKVAYLFDTYDRKDNELDENSRGYSNSDENTIRLSYDVMGLSFFAVRVGYDYGQRRGTGFVLEQVDYENPALVGPGGEQPGLRYYDEADRNRTRAQLLVSANPHEMASVYFQWAYQKDEYLADDLPNIREQFGLLNQELNSWNIGATINPNDKVAVGVNFGQELPSSFQRSRNANPPPDPSWTDPLRNWTLTNEDTANNFNLWLDLREAIKHADIRFGWDYSDSDQSFAFGGPRPAVLAATTPPSTGQFIPLPNVTNTWQRITADLKYFFNEKVGLGFGWYYEKLDVYDFATIDTSGSVFGLNPPTTALVDPSHDPRLEYLGEIMTGYMNRPYSGNNIYIRGLYRF